MTETGGGVSTPEPDGHSALVESDQHRGSPVFDPAGTRIGTICRVFVEASSQRLAYAEVTFGGIPGLRYGAVRYGLEQAAPGREPPRRFCADAEEVDEIERAALPSVS